MVKLSDLGNLHLNLEVSVEFPVFWNVFSAVMNRLKQPCLVISDRSVIRAFVGNQLSTRGALLRTGIFYIK